jgi:hypothetical protein
MMHRCGHDLTPSSRTEGDIAIGGHGGLDARLDASITQGIDMTGPRHPALVRGGSEPRHRSRRRDTGRDRNSEHQSVAERLISGP